MFNGWLSNRLLTVSRTNAKKIALALWDDPVPRLKLVYLCRGLSFDDCYWLKLSTDETTWSNINLYDNSLSDSIALAALHGNSVSVQGSVRIPEVANQGVYAKAWIRDKGDLFLYKYGANRSYESEKEVMVSQLTNPWS